MASTMTRPRPCGRRRRPGATLAPIVKTEFHPRVTRSGLTRPECWAAVTEDGAWQLARLEMTGTPWSATFAATGEEVWFPSLPKARRAIADGSAMALIEARRPEAAR